MSDLAASDSPKSTLRSLIQLPNIDLNYTVTLTNPLLRKLLQTITKIKKTYSNLNNTKSLTNYFFESDIDEHTFERLWTDW